MTSRSRRTDDVNCTFLLTLPRSLRTQLKAKLLEVEAKHGKTVFPNTAIVYLINKALGGEGTCASDSHLLLEECFAGKIQTTEVEGVDNE